jgi:hypothetical protein
MARLGLPTVHDVQDDHEGPASLMRWPLAAKGRPFSPAGVNTQEDGAAQCVFRPRFSVSLE